MRADRGLRVLPTSLTLALALAAVVLAVRKTAPDALSEADARLALFATCSIVVLAVAVALLRKLPARAGTLALDRHHRLADRLTNALAFDALPAASRAPLMEVAIDDACEHAGRLSPSKAAPITMPRAMAAVLPAAALLGAVALLEVRTLITPVAAPTIDALTMSPDDIELFKTAAKELAREDQSPEVKAAIERFNQLIEDIALRRLDRTEAFRRMEAIERELLQGAEADAKALQEALEQTGEDLKGSELAKPAGDALKKHDLEQAKRELAELAKKLRADKKVDKAQLERLRKALEKAAARRKEALAAVNEKRSELREDLLKKKSEPRSDAGAPEPEEERLLKKKERELERLDREAEQKERAGRQLDRLDRELSKAAEDLLRDLGLSADDLDRAAEDLNRMQQEAMTDQEKEDLRQRLEELRELLRQQGQGGKERMARMMRFGKRARGGSPGEPGEQQGQGQPGQPGQEGQEGQDGEGQQGQGQQGGKTLVLGPGGQPIPVPGGGSSPGQGKAPGEGQGEGGEGKEPGGQGIGSGHDANIAGKRTDPKMGTQDVQAQGLDSKDGPTNSEVILGAAERGFKGTPYKKVFTDYHTVAEEQIGKDDVPDGYRSYVRRYFQLIRPRE